MDNNFGIIYKVINKINGKIYIGQTIRKLRRRKNNHYADARRQAYNSVFHNSLMKYDEDTFKWEIIENCDSKEELDEMEFHYIKQFNTLRPNGYNLTLGGDGMVGFKFTMEQRRRMSDIAMGRKMTEAARLKLIKNHADFSGKKNPMYGVTSPMKDKKHTQVTKDKISKKLKGRSLTKAHKLALSVAAKRRWRLQNEKI
jgi:group I intron endonuclease